MKILLVNYKDADAPMEFCQSLKDTGFAVLKNHPVSYNLIFDAYTLWQGFFESTDKSNYHYQKPSQSGYFPFKVENAKDRKVGDLKEFYHFYPWGHNPENLKGISQKIYHELNLLASELLQWIDDALPSNISSKLLIRLKDMIYNSPKTLLRILHYPPLSSDIEPDAVRAAAHEDINLITLLPAATAPGLEVLDSKGNWHAVTCDPGNIVVNVGDMLQTCTDNYYKSTTHRVINPMDDNKYKSRFSMPFFLHPREEVYLNPSLTAKVYLEHRLKEIGIF